MSEVKKDAINSLRYLLKTIKKVIYYTEKGKPIKIEEGEVYDDIIDWLNSNALSWDGYDLQFAWGGPAYGFYIATNRDKEVQRITYYYYWWGEKYEMDLDGEDFELVEKLYNYALNI